MSSQSEIALRDESVLEEMRRIGEYRWVHEADEGYLRAHHIRFFRGKDTPTALRALSTAQVEASFARLAKIGEIEKKPGERAWRRPDWRTM